jgi:hypothetical protein
VDKTEVILRLLETGSTLFFSRPRRFGKSLLVSTLCELFKGNKKLFEGLAIYDKWDWDKKHPVVRIDWSSFAHRTIPAAEEGLMYCLRKTAQEYGVELTSKLAANALQELIGCLHEKTGERAVVLVDEYDMPIINALGKPDFETHREFLHDFYGLLKGAGDHLRFIFFTGVSKFAGLSVFSGLNNIRDVTLDPALATLCGYTDQELKEYFPEHLAAVAKEQNMPIEQLLEKTKFWYNGYSWDGETSVYNSFSILLFLGAKYFDTWWFDTGTPTFLIKILLEKNDIAPFMQPVIVNTLASRTFNAEDSDIVSLLFQTGYLTIKKIKRESFPIEYTLDVPNFEVRDAFLTWLLTAYNVSSVLKTQQLAVRTKKSILAGNVVELERDLREMIAGIPYKLHIPREAYYHSLFLVWLKLLGFDIQGEYLTDIGRIDAVWRLGERMILVEIKCGRREEDSEKLLAEAMKQIKEKHYADAFGGIQKTTCLAIVYTYTNRKLACRIEA